MTETGISVIATPMQVACLAKKKQANKKKQTKTETDRYGHQCDSNAYAGACLVSFYRIRSLTIECVLLS